MTINMLRLSQLNPGISAYEQVDGIHNFEQIPLAPLRFKVRIHEKPHKRLTYAPHSVDGWYLGPALHPYRCYTCNNIDPRGETTPYTIYFFPVFIKMLKAIRELSQIFDEDTKIPNRDALPSPPRFANEEKD